MAKSMTAFSYQESTGEYGECIWEIRSVNHRYLDSRIHLPEAFRSQENHYREQIKAKLKRGKIDASLRFTANKKTQNDITVNEPLARALIIASRQLESYIENPKPITSIDVLNWPGVAQEIQADVSVAFTPAIQLLDHTLDDLIATRLREGQRLVEFILQRCDQIAEVIIQIRQRRPQMLDALRDKLLKRIHDLQLTLDENRLEQELVLLAQRFDVEEEIDRLMAHLDEINLILERNQPMGRRLDFLMQELNREANTLASKSHDSITTQAAVELKVLIEQMREQIQNLE
jgi:uncharacterized protein (TIGR00255 family)